MSPILHYPNATRIDQGLHNTHKLSQTETRTNCVSRYSSSRFAASSSRFIRSFRARICCTHESHSEGVTAVSDVIENVRINPSLQRLPPSSPSSAPVSRHVWFWTASKGVITAALEAGWDTFIVDGSEAEAEALSSMARMNLLIIEEMYDGSVINFHTGEEVAKYYKIRTGFDMEDMTRLRGQSLPVIMDSKNWKLISTENMVAAFQSSPTPIFATASNASEARDAFEALESGTDGVVMRTHSPSDVFALKEYLQSRAPVEVMPLSSAVVTGVAVAGMGDRVCVDLCSLMKPGEGMLVGSFARCLFLVHSECLEADYVASRPFRVNAGPVCAYVATPGGRTAYLSELRSGSEVMVADGQGRCYVAVVGRAKVERRPMVLVEVETENGSGPPCRHSVLLQNAETVRLVTAAESGERGRAISVSEIAVGDQILVALQEAARHTGIAIQESIAER